MLLKLLKNKDIHKNTKILYKNKRLMLMLQFLLNIHKNFSKKFFEINKILIAPHHLSALS